MATAFRRVLSASLLCVVFLAQACGSKINIISVTPQNASIAAGTAQQFSAVATYSDGKQLDISSSAKWTSSDESILFFVNEGGKGAAKARQAGAAVVTATFEGASGKATLTVTGATQSSIAITPPVAAIAVGTSQQLHVAATFSDGTAQDVTNVVTWTSSSASVTVGSTGLAQGVSAGAATVTATLGSLTATSQISVTAATLSSIAITPAAPSLHAGQTLQLTATGTFSDATTQDLTSGVTWTSSSSGVAAFLGAKGLVTGVTAGSTTLSAGFGEIAGQVTVTVTSPVVTSVVVAPAVSTIALGTTTALTATATLSDGSMEDVTATATWTSSDAVNAAVDASGHVQGSAVGSYTITATASGVHGTASVSVINAVLASLAITPVDVTVPVGSTVALTATGTFTDGSTQDLTSGVTWTSDDGTIATIAAGQRGRVTGVAAGTTTIRASVMGVSTFLAVTVTEAQVASLRVSPAFVTLALGTSAPLTATATLTDGTTTDVSATVVWSIDLPATASVSTAGVVNATAVGDAQVTATLGAFSATTAVKVTNATLVSIALSPESVSLPAGGHFTLSAIGTFSDASTQDITSSATWTSSDTDLLTVAGGLVTGVSAGTAVVTATQLGVTGSVGVTVTAPDVVSLAITPEFSSLARGTSVQLTATATLSDGTTEDVTASAEWAAVTPDGISVSPLGLVQTSATGSFVIGATFGGASDAAQITVTAAELTGITISPETPSVAVGLTTALHVTGTFTDGSIQDVTSGVVWTTSAPGIAGFAAGSPSGVVTGFSVGTATLTASVLAASAQVTVTVTAAELVSLQLDPPFATLALGTSQQLTATVALTDGSTQDVTSQVQWTVGAAGGLSVTAGGLVTASGVGASEVTASFSGLSATTLFTVTNANLVSIAVGPSGATTPVGRTVPLAAIGTFTDGTTQDLTSSADWSSSAPATCTVTTGVVRGVAVGTATVTASRLGISGQLDVSITAAVVASISVSPTFSTLALGTSQQLTATATFTDGATQDISGLAQWAVATGQGVTVSATGFVRAIATGSSDISVTYGGVSSTATVAVTAATLTSITVAPATSSIPVGTVVQLTATGAFTDGTTQDLTSSVVWTSSDLAVATVAGGKVAALTGGTVTLSAALSGFTGTASLEVTTAVLTSIAITPVSPVAPVGTTVQFTATGSFSDGSTLDITGVATWTSSDTDVATVSDTTAGLVTTVASGSVTLTATSGAVSATQKLNVTDAVLSSLTLSPSSLALASGTTGQITAIGTYTDGSERDLTSLATWSASEESVATVSNAQGTHGFIQALGVGTSGITATVGLVTSSVVLVTVSDAQLLSLELTPSNAVSPVGVPVTFTAIGTFTDTTQQDLTGQVSWTTSPAGIATFGAPGSALASRATGVAAGSTVVTATLGAISGTASLSISSASLTGITVSPASVSLPKGTSQQLTATGAYTDGSTSDVTTLVTWTSSVSATASVSNAQGSRGSVTALALGGASVTASLQGVVSAPTTVTVTDAVLTTVAVSPSFVAVPNGHSQAYTASGTYSDGQQGDITDRATWSIANPLVGTLTASGASVSVKAVAGSGSTTVTAALDGRSASATFSAIGAVLETLAIAPGDITLANGRSQTFTVTGTYSDGTSRDLTSSALWATTDAAVAQVDLGSVVAMASTGTATVSATFEGQTVSVRVTAGAPVLDTLAIEPSSSVIPNGLTQALVATGFFSDGSFSNVSALVNWSSSLTARATVSSTGLVTAKSAGASTITVSIINSEGTAVAASATVTVVAPLLNSIAVAPTAPSIAAGTSIRFTATGLYTDGTSQNITSLVTWVSSTPTVATVSNALGSVGLAQGASAGSSTISATLGAVTGQTALTVNTATLVSIEIAPQAPVLANGTSVQLSATGTYSNGSVQNLDGQVSWSVSGTALTIDGNGLLSANAVGSGVVTASLSGVDATTPATVTSATLLSIAVSPASSTIAKGTTVQLTATGTYSDGTTQNLTSLADWSSGDASLATVSNAGGSRGLVTGVATGVTQITVSLNGVSRTAAVTVSAATLTTVSVTPAALAFAKGTTKVLVATGTYSDGTVQDLTTQATWSSGDPSIVTVSNAVGSQGVLTGVAAGSTTITATVSGVAGTASASVTDASLTSVSVSPATLQIASGTNFQFTATGLYSDGTSQDLTSSVTWSSSDTDTATISNSATSRGLAHGVAVGTVTLTATLGASSGTASLTVSSATLSSIAVSPVSPVLANGTSTQLTALGTYSDGSTQDLTGQVTWSSSTGATAFSATTAGLLQAVSVGTSTLTATFTGVSGVATATVTDASLVSLEIAPASPTLASGTSLHLAATGTYSDGSTQDVTSLVAWASSASSIASVSNATGSRGLVTAGSQGAATISATLGAVTVSIDVTVTNAVLQSIAIAPSVGVLPKGTTASFTATGTYSDGTEQDLTTQVTWSTVDVGIAAVSTAVGSEGVVTALTLGQTDLVASFNGVTQTVTLTVTAPTLTTITVSPAVSSIAAGTSVALTATGIYSDSSSQDLTSSVTWTTSNGAAVTVSNDAATHGLAHGVATGSATLTATFTGVSGTASVSVTAATLSSIQITPASPVLARGTSAQLTATGTFSDGSNQDLTGSVSWSSDSAALGFSGTTPGLLLAQSVGSATLTASLDGVSGSTTATVTDATLTSINVFPTDPTIAKGTTVQLSASGTYSDGTTQDISSLVTWTSSATSLVSVSNTTGSRGLATGVATGVASITATLGAVSASSDVTVTGATLDSVVVTPPAAVIAKGTTQVLAATGVYSDGSQQDLTAQVTWSTSDAAIAVVSSAVGTQGLVTGLDAGTVQITASFNGFSASATVTITNAALESVEVAPSGSTIANGTTQQFVATGHYSDGSTQDVTSTVTWSSSSTAVASISNAAGSRGLASGVGVGTVSIIATLTGISGEASLTISAATLTSITVTPSSASIARNATQQLRAVGHYSDATTQDITTQVTWTSSNTTTATVSNTAGSKGVVTGRAAGTVTITAGLNGVTGTSTVVVTSSNLSSIQVTPPTARLAIGLTLALRATGTYSDNTTQDLTSTATWTTSNATVATVSSTGVVTAKAAGTATISAAFGGRTGTSAITVASGTLSSIAVTPAAKTYPGGVAVQFKATGVYSDNNTQDLSALVTWNSSNTGVATVSSTGVVTTIAAGTSTISVTFGAFSGQTTVKVSTATLSSVVVTPATVKLARDTTATLRATATFSDGSTLDVTSAATWTSSNGPAATVSSTGLVTGVAAGSATVTGTWSGASGTSAVTVTAATLTSISLGGNTTVQKGFSKQLKATGTFSDGTTQDLTELATWTSASANATVSNVSGSRGLVYGVTSSFFSVRITAIVGGVTGTANVTVSISTFQSIAISAVTGSSLTSPTGFATHMQAIGTYRNFFGQTSTADITSQVSWSTSNAAVAVAGSPAGVISAVSPGTATVRATFGTLTASATMTVTTATLSSIAVTTTSGGAASVNVGSNLTLKATGTFSNGTTLDISGEAAWTSANPAKVTVVGGFPATVTGVASTAGTAITATAAGVTGSRSVAVP